MSMFENMMGKIGPGMCRLSMSGGIAIKTKNGYKSYDVKKGKLTNCTNFVFNMDGMDMFFMIPTNHVKTGDIIIANGTPKCVIEVNKDKSIKCLDYEDSRIDTIVPERHVFLGNTYFYGKIVSLFGDSLKSGKGNSTIMKWMMLSSMMGNKSGGLGDMNSMLPMMMFMGGEKNLFNDMFDSLSLDDVCDVDEEDEDEEEDKEE